VQHEKTYANLEAGDDVLSIGLNRAVTLIAEKKLKGPRGRRFGADPGRVLGDHPVKGGPIMVKNGRYGPYVSHAGINATLPADKTTETVTLDEAVGLIDARAEAGGSRSRRKTSVRKPAAKSARPRAAKKPPKKTAAAAKKPNAKRSPAKPKSPAE
jgi:DNA topoisomerase-1